MLDRSHIFAKLDGGGKQKAWIRAHLDYPHDWCLIWPFARGEGKTTQFGNPSVNLPRFMCEYRNGPPPTSKHQAAHSCGRGHDGCANPLHLSWKTNSENQIERYQHSGPVPRAKLNPQQVDEIRALKDRARVPDIAKQFGVSEVTIRSIHAGKLWKNTSSLQQRHFTEAEVRLIRSTTWQEKPARDFANEYGVGINVIHRIRNLMTYKWVADE